MQNCQNLELAACIQIRVTDVGLKTFHFIEAFIATPQLSLIPTHSVKVDTFKLCIAFPKIESFKPITWYLHFTEICWFDLEKQWRPSTTLSLAKMMTEITRSYADIATLLFVVVRVRYELMERGPVLRAAEGAPVGPGCRNGEAVDTANGGRIGHHGWWWGTARWREWARKLAMNSFQALSWCSYVWSCVRVNLCVNVSRLPTWMQGSQ